MSVNLYLNTIIRVSGIMMKSPEYEIAKLRLEYEVEMAAIKMKVEKSGKIKQKEGICEIDELLKGGWKGLETSSGLGNRTGLRRRLK